MEIGEFLGQFISCGEVGMAEMSLQTLCERHAILKITRKPNPIPNRPKQPPPVYQEPYNQLPKTPVVFQMPPGNIDFCSYIPPFQSQFPGPPVNMEGDQRGMQFGASSLPTEVVDRNAIKDRLMKDGIPLSDAHRLSCVHNSYSEAREEYRRRGPI